MAFERTKAAAKTAKKMITKPGKSINTAAKFYMKGMGGDQKSSMHGVVSAKQKRKKMLEEASKTM